MKIDISRPVYDLVKDNPKLKETLIDLGFKGLDNPIMVQTMAKKMSIKRGSRMMGIEGLVEKLEKEGYEVYDSSQTPEAQKRKDLIKSYIERLSQGEDLEGVREDFVKNFKGVSSSEIMDAEEDLLNSGADKEQVRKLCDIHSALFHGMTENENKKDKYEGQAFLSYMNQENDKIKDLVKAARSRDDFTLDLGKITSHYKKKGDLIYPLLKVKYNKPGPSDVMWAVDVEIIKSLKRAQKEKNEKLWQEALQRADEMTYKEENILYPLVKENLTGDDLDLAHQDLKDYDHDLVAYEERRTGSSKGREDGYIHFKKGKLRLDQLEALLDTLEIELTFVDENDLNAYYNNPKEAKVFKRPTSSLGRPVYSCHPPQIEPMVRGLIQDFKDGEKDSFKLMKKMGEKIMAISYYAVRNEEGEYKGVLETVQDLTYYKDLLGKEER